MESPPISVAQDIDGKAARAIRLASGLTIDKFWGAIAVSYSTGSMYEHGRNRIPGPAQRLLFLHYVLGFPTDINRAEFEASGGAAQMAKVRSLYTSMRGALALTTQAAALLQEPLNEST